MTQPPDNHDVASSYVLDAMRLAALPEAHRIAALAATYKLMSESEPLISLMSEPGPDRDRLRQAVFDESVRQSRVRRARFIAGIRDRSPADVPLPSGPFFPPSSYSYRSRRGRLGAAVFGNVDNWVSLCKGKLDLSDGVSFDWFKRDASLNVVTGIEILHCEATTDCIPGFAIKSINDLVVRVGPLPERPKGFSHLLLLLGLPMTYLDGRPISLDCVNRTFIVSRTNVLPWTRY